MMPPVPVRVKAGPQNNESWKANLLVKVSLQAIIIMLIDLFHVSYHSNVILIVTVNAIMAVLKQNMANCIKLQLLYIYTFNHKMAFSVILMRLAFCIFLFHLVHQKFLNNLPK